MIGIIIIALIGFALGMYVENCRLYRVLVDIVAELPKVLRQEAMKGSTLEDVAREMEKLAKKLAEN